MNNWIKILALSYIITLISGCSSEELVSPEEQPIISENVYLEQNKWIYAQMNQNYLWRDDLPDSAACNYDQNPKEFFQSILSNKDRFSYLTTNESYRPQQLNVGFSYQIYRDRNGTDALNVLYTTSSDVKNKGIKRGDYLQIISTDGFYIYMKKVKVEDGLFVCSENQSPIVLSLLDDKNKTNILCNTVFKVGDTNIGYLCYLQFEDTP